MLRVYRWPGRSSSRISELLLLTLLKPIVADPSLIMDPPWPEVLEAELSLLSPAATIVT
jgi:hypothetical protein